MENKNSFILIEPVAEIEMVKEKEIKQYLNHDVLRMVEVYNEVSSLLLKRLRPEDDRMSWREEIKEYDKEWIKDEGVGQMKQILLRNDLDYRIILNEDMSVFDDIMDRYNTNHSYLEEEVDRVGYDMNFQEFSVSAIFDQQDSNYVYILASMDEILTGGENNIITGQPPGRAIALLLYKYNLLSDEFECLYNAYKVLVLKDGIMEFTKDPYNILAQSDFLVYVPAEINAIDKDNNLILSLGSGLIGLGGREIPVVFEGLTGWDDLYFFNTKSKELTEFQYTEDETYYNSDLYDFLIFDYYPKYFDEENYEGMLERYNEF